MSEQSEASVTQQECTEDAVQGDCCCSCDGGWRKSPLLAALLVAIIVSIWAYMIKTYYLDKSARKDAIQAEMNKMPFTMLAEGETGKENLYVGVGARPREPFLHDGKQYWSAYICTFEDCPGREGDTPLLFSGVRPEWSESDNLSAADFKKLGKYNFMVAPKCPACAEAGVGGSEYVQIYVTEEEKRIHQRIRDQIKR